MDQRARPGRVQRVAQPVAGGFVVRPAVAQDKRLNLPLPGLSAHVFRIGGIPQRKLVPDKAAAARFGMLLESVKGHAPETCGPKARPERSRHISPST